MTAVGRVRTAFGLAGAFVALAGCGFNLPTAHSSVPGHLVPLFRAAAATYGVMTPAQLAAQARVESKFNPSAHSRAGARGLMQFLPDTWRQFGVDGDHDGRKDPMDPADAIPSAARYDAHLADLLHDVPGDRFALVLAAYNAGPSAVQKAGGIPAYPETRAYVEKVQGWAIEFRGQL